jgi:hypothetical protein
MSAATTFARYAYPPNELGYCGPADAAEVLRCHDETLEATARCFDGVWPYFEFIASRHGLEPLDPAVIESYWLGGDLVEMVDVKAEGADLLAALAAAGGTWAHTTNDLLAGMAPDHNFHVFAVYPWLGLLPRNISDQPRVVLDRCRIRWGNVIALSADDATVECSLLEWDGKRLGLGEPVAEPAVLRKGQVRLAGKVREGDLVALHWDWVCDVIAPGQAEALRRSTVQHLEAANRRLDLGLAG